MGEVFRARDPKLNRDVAIKVWPAALNPPKVELIQVIRKGNMALVAYRPSTA